MDGTGKTESRYHNSPNLKNIGGLEIEFMLVMMTDELTFGA